MKPHGTYKLSYARNARVAERAGVGTRRLLPAPDLSPLTGVLERLAASEHRARRMLDSLRDQILEGGGGRNLRIRQVFRTPREIYRLELELPELGYQRTTFLDRDALEQLLEADDIREVVESASLGR